MTTVPDFCWFQAGFAASQGTKRNNAESYQQKVYWAGYLLLLDSNRVYYSEGKRWQFFESCSLRVERIHHGPPNRLCQFQLCHLLFRRGTWRPHHCTSGSEMTEKMTIIHTLWWTNILPWKDPPLFMGKSTISMAIFHGFWYVHQRVINHTTSMFSIYMFHIIHIQHNQTVQRPKPEKCPVIFKNRWGQGQ